MKSAFDRFIKDQIVSELESDKIILITGPRQSGKTTLLNEISTELKSKDGGAKSVFYFNFDRLSDLEFFKNQQKVEAFLKLRSLKSKLYLLIDEVQRKPDAGTFFKFFYDEGMPVKFIFTGSSSIELNDSFGDALTGRKRVFTLLPLSVNEIASGSMEEEYDLAKKGEPLSMDSLTGIIEERLIWGGYPEVTVKENEKSKLRVLSELYESYIQKDVKDLLRVKNVSGFNLLVKYLAHNIGENLVIDDLSRQTGMHVNTVNSYLDILEGTMVISRLANFNPEMDSKLPKSTRFYFVDNGMRNYALNNLQSDFRMDLNKLVANLAYSELAKFAQKKHVIEHYQTYSDNHIDFILRDKTASSFTPIVIRYQDESERLGKKIHEFINTMSPGRLIVVTKSFAASEEVKGCRVELVPLVEFILRVPKMLG